MRGTTVNEYENYSRDDLILVKRNEENYLRTLNSRIAEAQRTLATYEEMRRDVVDTIDGIESELRNRA